MKNNAIIIVLIISGIISAVLIGFYFVRQNGSAVNSPKNTAREHPDSDQAETGRSQSKLVTDDFEIGLPAGWRQTAPAIGASAMAVNVDEDIDDPAAERINFKSYFAVSYDTLQGKDVSEYLQTVKNGLQQAISSVVFTKDQDMTINGRSAHAMEAELAQQGVDFKILMVVVKGQGNDFWVISFNTTKSSWGGYKETFYGVADSFSLKE